MDRVKQAKVPRLQNPLPARGLSVGEREVVWAHRFGFRSGTGFVRSAVDAVIFEIGSRAWPQSREGEAQKRVRKN